MKTLTILCLMLSASSALAVTPSKMTGEFIEKHSIAMMMYQEEECKTAGGSWDGEICIIDTEDSVKVTRAGGKFGVAVDTVGNNAHSCSFAGKAERLNDKTLVSSVKSEYFDGKEWKKGVCKVTVKYANDNTVNVSTNGKCESFCGAHARLELSSAKRK